MSNFIMAAAQQFPPATGGNEVFDINVSGTTYRVHKFTSSGTFTVYKNLTCEYLIVAGGGSPAVGWDVSAAMVGGAGAGGVLQGSSSFSAGNFTVLIGAGGSAMSNTTGYTLGNNGENSSISSIATAIGGGTSGTSGGSGGGGTHRQITFSQNPSPGGSGTVGQGFNGGSSSTWSGGQFEWRGGGGGGANAAGSNGVLGGAAGSGGVGIQSSIDGTSKYYAGGGGGGSAAPAGVGSGGLGGGGNGSFGGPGVSGSPNTGGGGGGGVTSRTGSAGGSGIVIIRYPI